MKLYCTVNNKLIKNQYKLDDTSTFDQYLDAKKLYGWAIRKKLPTCGFASEEVEDLMPERIYKLKKG